jgi:NADH dehydrogenase
MAQDGLYAVTGAFGFTGKYIARLLLSMGGHVRALVRPGRHPNPFGDSIDVASFTFDNPARLMESLRGVETLFNTYWVRFCHCEATFDSAVENTKLLLKAAQNAGVRKIVHISIANPSERSPYPYFRGKAALERVVTESGLRYAIIRPAVVFGVEDILFNNIAWFLRQLPVFFVPGAGQYRIRPVFVEDVARLAVDAAAEPNDRNIDAVSPEVFTFDELVELIGRTVGTPRRLIHLHPRTVLFALRPVGWALRDVVLTADEVGALMADLLVTSGEATGLTSFSQWVAQHAETLGRHYASELRRHYG